MLVETESRQVGRITIGGKSLVYTDSAAFEGETFYFCPEHAQKAVDFFPECLRHAKGEWEGQPVVLEPWQKKRIVEPAFGWVDRDGLRRFRVVYIEVPRKNGKSTMVAGMGIYLLIADNEPGPEVYSCAADKDQAKIVFDVARSMRDRSPFLNAHLQSFRNVLYCGDNGGIYRVLSADAFTKHGLNSHGIIFDEFHAQPSRDLFDVMLTSTGSRRQPLFVIITTAGFDRNSICWEQHQYAEKVRDGIIDDPHFLPVIFGMTPDEDKDDPHAWKREETWRRVNPNYGVSLKADYIQREFKRALESPAYENTFKRLHLNLWTEQESRWLPMDKWDEAHGEKPLTEKALKGRRCFVGIDAASTGDVFALACVFPPIKKDEPVKALMYFLVPQEAAKHRTEKQRVPYLQWIKQGYMIATPGAVTDYEFARKIINRLGELFDIAEVGYDPWNLTQLATQLEGDGFTMVPVRQGFGSMSAPSKHLLGLVLAGLFDHGNNPVLRWMASNVAVVQDAAGNIKPAKDKSSEKIDGITAIICGIARMIATPDKKPSVYETRGVLTI